MDQLSADFNRHYYDGNVWEYTTWIDVQMLKAPTDLWIYQEIIFELRPDVIVESGTHHGGSALFLANMCDLVNHGRVVTIDLQPYEHLPVHPRITYLAGSSTATATVRQVHDIVPDGARCLVILDSDHSRGHVLAELDLYAPLVVPGSYVIVEDTNVNGHPVLPDFGPGPMEAVDEFLAAHPEFQADRAREKFGLTFNPRGYLRRIE